MSDWSNTKTASFNADTLKGAMDAMRKREKGERIFLKPNIHSVAYASLWTEFVRLCDQVQENKK